MCYDQSRYLKSGHTLLDVLATLTGQACCIGTASDGMAWVQRSASGAVSHESTPTHTDMCLCSNVRNARSVLMTGSCIAWTDERLTCLTITSETGLTNTLWFIIQY